MKLLGVRADLSEDQRPLFWRLWWFCRCRAYQLICHKYFETFIIFMIVLSSISLVRYALCSTYEYTVLCALRKFAPAASPLRTVLLKIEEIEMIEYNST